MLGTAVAQAGGFGGNMGVLVFIGIILAVVWLAAQSSDGDDGEVDEDGRRVVRVRRVRIRRRRRKR